MLTLESYLAREIQELKDKGTFRNLRVLAGEPKSRSRYDGKQVVNLSSNNYLGLATHPRLKQAMTDATMELGVGAGAVRTISGTMEIHERLEQELALFKHTEASLVFQSGFTANYGVIGSIMTKEDVILSDELNHASIIDGIRLSPAKRKIYRHADIGDLRTKLREASQEIGSGGKILIVTDGVFSMDGDIAPLPEIVDAAEHYGAFVMVDDAHASGVLGQNGRGSVNHFGLDGRVAIQVGTLSKAVGVLGGYVACSQALRDIMIHRARPFLFSTAHPPGVAAANLEAIRVLQEEPEWVEQLWDNTHFFKQGLERLGFDTGNSQTPITPVIIGQGAKAMMFSDQLFAKGVFAQALSYPTVPEEKSRVRTIVSATHTKDDLEFALNAFAETGRALEVI